MGIYDAKVSQIPFPVKIVASIGVKDIGAVEDFSLGMHPSFFLSHLLYMRLYIYFFSFIPSVWKLGLYMSCVLCFSCMKLAADP